MSDIRLADGSERRYLRAMIWSTRLQTGPLTPKQLRALKVWRATPENRRALKLCDVSWQKLGELRPRQRSQWRGTALALKVAVCVSLVTTAIGWAIRTPTDTSHTAIETKIAEWETKKLEDGSIVRVGPRTLVRVEFDEKHRSTRVLRGEALFDVAKDPYRPFVVEVEGIVARAIGTRFAVAAVKGAPVITVAEGLVRVYRPESPEQDAIQLPAGTQVAFRGDGSMVRRNVDTSVALAWTERRLQVAGRTAAEVVDEFNLRNRLQIRVDDARLAHMKVFGDFSLDDPESFANMLSMFTPGIVVREQPDLLVVEPCATSPCGDEG